MSWYAIHTKPRAEFMAYTNLVWMGLDAYCPRVLRKITHARSTVEEPRPLFSRYLFLRENLEAPLWADAMSSKTQARIGISTVIYSASGGVLRIPDSIIEELHEREVDGFIADDRDEALARKLHRGDQVRVRVGTFADLLAVVENVDNPQRIRLTTDLLGRQIVAVAPAGELEIVSPRSAQAFVRP